MTTEMLKPQGFDLVKTYQGAKQFLPEAPSPGDTLERGWFEKALPITANGSAALKAGSQLVQASSTMKSLSGLSKVLGDTANGLCFLGVPLSTVAFVRSAKECKRVASENGVCSKAFADRALTATAAAADIGFFTTTSVDVLSANKVLPKTWSGLSKLASGFDFCASVIGVFKGISAFFSTKVDENDPIDVRFAKAKDLQKKSHIWKAGMHLANATMALSVLSAVVLSAPWLLALSLASLVCSLFSYWNEHRMEEKAKQIFSKEFKIVKAAV